MQLRQWECSHIVGDNNTADATDNMGEISNVLGMIWDKGEDTLRCNIDKIEVPEKVTKRVVLSIVQKIYDPLGIVCVL